VIPERSIHLYPSATDIFITKGGSPLSQLPGPSLPQPGGSRGGRQATALRSVDGVYFGLGDFRLLGAIP
jgi:hypothetical protein